MTISDRVTVNDHKKHEPMCALYLFLPLMLNLLCGFRFTTSTTNVIQGLTDVMANVQRLSGRVANN